MFKNIESSYYASPGAEIAEWLEENNHTQQWLADKLGISRKSVNKLVNGKARLTEFTAIELENIMGVKAEYWVRREGSYRLALAFATEEGRKVEQQDGSYAIPSKGSYQYTDKFDYPELNEVEEFLTDVTIGDSTQYSSSELTNIIAFRGVAA